MFGLCNNVLCTDNFQFAFKGGIGCPDAIFALKSVIHYFIDRGSSIFIALLDVSKAFDRVNHFKLLNSLLDAGMPIAVVEVLCKWYTRMFVVIRWNNSLSRMFAVKSGVRQGRTLSPSIFSVFMDAFIVNLRLFDVGCHVNHQFVGFFVCRWHYSNFTISYWSATNDGYMFGYC